MSRRGALRASDADRDQIIDRLHRAATEGRIAAEELEERVSLALKAKTYAELEVTVADLPSADRNRSRARHPAVPVARWTVRSVRANPLLLLLLLPALAVTFAMLLAATILWAVLVTVALVLGHRQGPWIGPGHHRARAHALRAARRSWV
ncbi:MAG: DUF1707 domain-containing protein [Solirubrobacteraceae bacterium]